jgi:dihydropteroate synthase
LNGGLGLAALSVSLGASIIRTHDVAPTVDAIRGRCGAAKDESKVTNSYFGTDGVRGRVGQSR